MARFGLLLPRQEMVEPAEAEEIYLLTIELMEAEVINLVVAVDSVEVMVEMVEYGEVAEEQVLDSLLLL